MSPADLARPGRGRHRGQDGPRRPRGPAAERYRRRLAAERDEAAIYRALAERRNGEEREILLALAEAEERHAEHWAALLAGAAGGHTPPEAVYRPGLRARVLAWVARRVGTLAVLGMVQRAELQRSTGADAETTAAMAADELVHARVVGGLAHARRARASSVFRAVVFGMNDGLVSNLSLVLGISAAGATSDVVLLTGLAGLIAGALSMAAGEYVSIRSQRELLDTGHARLDRAALEALRYTDANELALVFRAQGLEAGEADAVAGRLLEEADGAPRPGHPGASPGEGARSPADVVGSALRAAVSSFGAFAAGATVPVLPFLVTRGAASTVAAVVLAGLALFATGCTIGVYSGGPVLRRGLRQLGIGALAAAVTYALGTLFGVTLG